MPDQDGPPNTVCPLRAGLDACLYIKGLIRPGTQPSPSYDMDNLVLVDNENGDDNAPKKPWWSIFCFLLGCFVYYLNIFRWFRNLQNLKGREMWKRHIGHSVVLVAIVLYFLLRGSSTVTTDGGTPDPLVPTTTQQPPVSTTALPNSPDTATTERSTVSTTTEPPSTTTTDMPKDESLYAKCDANDIPDVIKPDSNRLLVPPVEDGKAPLFFIPCKNAHEFNVALLEHVNNRLADGLWYKYGNRANAPWKSGVPDDLYQLAYIDYVMSITRNTNRSLDIPTSLFGFEQIKCAQMNKIEYPWSPHVCLDAATVKDDFEVDGRTESQEIDFIQEKIMIFALAFGEYSSVFKPFLSFETEIDNELYMLFAEGRDYGGMANLVQQQETPMFKDMLSKFFKKLNRCMEEHNANSNELWSDYFLRCFDDEMTESEKRQKNHSHHGL